MKETLSEEEKGVLQRRFICIAIPREIIHKKWSLTKYFHRNIKTKVSEKAFFKLRLFAEEYERKKFQKRWSSKVYSLRNNYDEDGFRKNIFKGLFVGI